MSGDFLAEATHFGLAVMEAREKGDKNEARKLTETAARKGAQLGIFKRNAFAGAFRRSMQEFSATISLLPETERKGTRNTDESFIDSTTPIRAMPKQLATAT